VAVQTAEVWSESGEVETRGAGSSERQSLGLRKLGRSQRVGFMVTDWWVEEASKALLN